MKHKIFLFIYILLSFSFAIPVHINYSTYLTGADGKARTNLTNKNFTFKLYSSYESTNPFWEETILTSTPNGFLSVQLGKTTPIPISSVEGGGGRALAGIAH